MFEEIKPPNNLEIRECLDQKFKGHENNVFMQAFKAVIVKYRSEKIKPVPSKLNDDEEDDG
jgi:hypothetical protein